MVDFITHVYKAGSPPFQTLSELPDAQAVALMKSLYCKDSIFWQRFADPLAYLCTRRQLECTLKTEFEKKGGRPKQDSPIYFMLGWPSWAAEMGDAETASSTEKIEVPLSIFDKQDISFTYPDSMVSALMAGQRNPEYYEPEYHGRVFTLDEMVQIIARKGLPGEQWKTKMPRYFAHYVEVQVWNRQTLSRFLETKTS